MVCLINPVTADTSRQSNEAVSGPTSTKPGLLETNNRFGFKFFGKLSGVLPEQNIVVSPLSVLLAFGLAYNGAAGDTRDSIRLAMDVPDIPADEINKSYSILMRTLSSSEYVIFKNGNSVWYREGFAIKKGFLDAARTFFDADVSEIDFSKPSAADIIDGWVSQKTNDKIRTIVKRPINPLTMLYLINAIYFKGIWKYEFDSSLTYDDSFNLSDGNKQPCRMMHQKAQFSYTETDSFQAVRMLYGAGGFNMTVILPRDGIDMNGFVANLSTKNWNEWTASFSVQEVDLHLPRFRVESAYCLNDILKSMGMSIAFSGNADFSNICDGTLFISEVRHKTFMEVNEVGTEAAAATIIELRKGMPKRIKMLVNRPFIFTISEDATNTIIFMGKIASMEAESELSCEN
jgi:serpin B